VLASQLGLRQRDHAVDAVNGASQLEHYAEAAKQVAVADRLLITKTDLAATARVDALRADLARINPAVQMHAVRTEKLRRKACLTARGRRRYPPQRYRALAGAPAASPPALNTGSCRDEP